MRHCHFAKPLNIDKRFGRGKTVKNGFILVEHYRLACIRHLQPSSSLIGFSESGCTADCYHQKKLCNELSHINSIDFLAAARPVRGH